MLLTQNAGTRNQVSRLNGLRHFVSRGAICMAVWGAGAAMMPAAAQQAQPGDPECPVVDDVMTCSGDLSDGFLSNLDPDLAEYNFENLTAPVAPPGYFGIGIVNGARDISVSLDDTVIIDVYDDLLIPNPAQGLVVFNDGHNIAIDSAAQITATTPDMAVSGIEARVYNRSDALLTINNTGAISVTSDGTGERDLVTASILAALDNATGTVDITNSGALSVMTAPGSFDSDFNGVAAGIVINTNGETGQALINNSGTITASGPAANGIVGFANHVAGSAASGVDIQNSGEISLDGTNNYGVLAQTRGDTSDAIIRNTADITMVNTGNTNGLFVLGQSQNGTGEIVNSGDITATGASARAIGLTSSGAPGAGTRSYTVNNTGTLTLNTDQALGITVAASAGDDADVTLYNGGDILATGTTADVSYGLSVNFSGSEVSQANVTNDASIRFGTGIGAFLTASDLSFTQTANGVIEMTGAGAEGVRMLSLYSSDFTQEGAISSSGENGIGVALVDRNVADGEAVSAAYDRDADYAATVNAVFNAGISATGLNGDGLLVSLGETYVGTPTADDLASYTGTATLINNSSITGGSGTGAGVRISGPGTTTLTNNGTINAASGNAVIGGNGSETIINAGTLNGSVALGAGDDNVQLLAGSSTGSIDLGEGDDELEIRFGAVLGGAADAGAGNDTLRLVAGAAQAGLIDYSGFTGFTLGEITGGGEWTLSGDAAAETTAFSVLSGRLIIDGDLSGSSVDVASGSLLGGSGTAGDVVIADGGILAPGGDGVGTLTMGSLLLNAGSVMNFDLGAPDQVGGTDNDLVEVSGDLTLDGTLNINARPAFGAGVYRIINYGGDLTDNGLNVGTAPAALYAVQTAVDGQVNLVVGDISSLAIQFWDGEGDPADGTISGGSGVWTSSDDNWTNMDGTLNAPPAGQFMIFQNTGGTVTVEGVQDLTGMQFVDNGYLLVAGTGGGLNFTDPGTSSIRVDAGVTAELDLPITTAGALLKQDTGTLVLTGDSDIAGNLVTEGGTVRIEGGAQTSIGDQLRLGAVTGPSVTVDINGAGTDVYVENGIETFATGLLRIAGGATMDAGSADISSGGSVEITGAGSVLDLSRSGTLAIGATGDGSVTVAGGGTLTAPTVTLGAGGTLNIGAGAGDAAAATGSVDASTIDLDDPGSTLVFNHTGTDYAFDPVLGGNGTISHLAGVTRLTGANSGFLGLTDVLGGTLEVNSALGGTVQVASGATLRGTGSLGDADISGTLSPGGGSIGTLSAGSVTFRDGSTFAVDVAADGSRDLLDVTGTALLEGGTVSVTTLDPDTAYTDGSVFTILTAGGGVTGTFAGVSDNSAFVDFLLTHGANEVSLSTQIIATFPDVALTWNQAETAVALSNLTQDAGSDPLAVYNAFLGLDADQARTAFGSASGEIHAGVQHAVDRSSSLFANTLIGRPVVERGGWLAPLGQWGKVKSDGNASELDLSTFGLSGGYDFAGPATTAGLALGYSQTDASIDALASDAEITSWHFGGYTSWTQDALSLSAAVTYATSSIDTERSVAVGTLSRRTSASYDADSLMFNAEGAYALAMDAGWTLAPVATLTAGQTKLDGGQESGANALDLAIGSETFKTLNTGLGAEGRFDLGEGRFTARLVWEHAFSDVRPGRTLTLSGSPTPFNVHGPKLDRDRARIGLGYETGVSETMSLSARYDAAVSGSDTNHAARLALSLRF